ncbi:MAG: thioredoxin family protein [Pseudomonadota bacterium]
MKCLLTIVFSFAVFFNSNLAWSAGPQKSAEPMAVFIAADWCGNCKVLEPKLHDALKGFEHKINFVNIDVTDDKRFFQSKQVVFKLGVPKLLKGSVTVGWVALFDRNGNQVGKIMQDMSVDEMKQAFQALSAKSI